MKLAKISKAFSFLGNAAIVGAFIFVGLFLLAAFANGSSTAKRLPNVPVETKFQVTAEIVELTPNYSVLGSNSFRTILDDIPKRRQVALDILSGKDVPGN